MFNFTPLLGAQSSSPASQSLLEFEGGIKVLVDVGWGNTFDVSKLKELERHVPTLSLVLLTHATPSHIAAFAHCCKHFPLFKQIPIYATLPVISLGRTLLQDIYSSTPLAASVIPRSSFEGTSLALALENPPQILLQPPTAEEILAYFSLINPLKYSQPHQPLPSPFSPPLNGLTITAYNAGHSLGGSIWHIQHGMESVVYAVDWNQVRENVFSGAAWLGSSVGGGAEVIEQLRKPTALICSAKGVEKTPMPVANRDELLLDMLRSALAKGGTVLVPTDSSARALELAYLLDHAWRQEPKNPGDFSLKSAKLYLTNRSSGATMRLARSELEWMDAAVVREFESGANAATTMSRQHKKTDSKRNNQDDANQGGKSGEQAGGPFDFKYLKLVQRKSLVEKILSKSGPQVILASDSSLAWGFSKDVLVRIAENPSNLVILTEDYSLDRDPTDSGEPNIGQTLWKWYNERRDGVAVDSGPGGQTFEQVHTGGRELTVVDATRTPLEGKELILYQQYLATQRQLQNTAQGGGGTALDNAADAIDETSSTSSSSSEESDSERQGKALNYSTTFGQANKNKVDGGKVVLGVNVLLKEPGVYDYDVRGKKGRESMFPYVTKRRRADEFGELIRPEDYLRAEERDEIDGQDLRENGDRKNAGRELGQKRKWGDSDMPNGQGQQTIGANKRRRISDGRGKDGSRESVANGIATDMVDDELSTDSDSDTDDIASIPSKLSFQTTTVTANLRIAFIDFAGIHDQRNLTRLLSLIQPRKLILVGGTESETKWLAEDCRRKLRPRPANAPEEVVDDIFTPLVGELVSASMDTNAWTLKLSKALVRKLHWQSVKGLGVVTLMGRLAATKPPEQPEAARKRQKTLKQEGETEAEEEKKPVSDLPPTLDVLPANMIAATRAVAQPLHVGDLRLAELRRILQTTGHTAEFRGQGTLVIDGLVAVRKSAGGQIEIEGGGLRLSEILRRDEEPSFNAVKRRIYEGLAVISGE